MTYIVTDMLPKDLLEELKTKSISKEELIFSARSDMNEERRYSDGYVILTKKRLIITRLPVDEKRVRVFGGYRDHDFLKQENLNRDWKIDIYSLNQIESIEVEMLVTGGRLYGTIDSEDYVLAVFTN